MTKTNVAFFINDITSSGGTERVTCLISNMLQSTNDYNIVIISLNETHGGIKFPLQDQVRTARINKTPRSGIYRFPIVCARLAHLVRQYKVDVLIDVDGILDLYSIPVKILTRVKLISWEHFNYHQNPDVPYRKVSRQLAGIFASAIVTLTKQDQQNYEQNLKFKRAKILTIPNPMILQVTHPYTQDSKTIVSAGRLTYQKGFDMLVDVAAQILPQRPDWQWLVLGDGEDHDVLVEQARERGLSKQLHFLGRTDDLGAYLEQAAFFVMTSRFEGLPMVLLEAKAYGLPLVSFDCETGPQEIIQDEVNGFLIPCFDMDYMAKQIDALIESSAERVEFAKHTEKGNIEFQPDSVQAKWLHLLESVSQ
ncbi:glycosyltransferase family 4 protein [Bifidobacterium pseudolongum]|uniref:glycosyltransferase family 4 protein n=1 Tax=Bifidobacterium pseudolongum TaxID=1694 RepID=UPI001F110EEA|nr:glycosyltransferase family 4 protein [Bifidobacterium pseudolongum]MCH4853772.1 glycosyltransferase family 4 protein [Bifidobacterium pseudolongum]